MRKTLVLLAALIVTSTLGVQPSRAQFAECTDEYINSFRQLATAAGESFSWLPGQVDCHEFWSFSFSTPDGTRWIRLIGDADATPDPRIRTAAEVAARLMSTLGSYSVDNITLLLAPEAATFMAAHADGTQGVRPDAWAIRRQIKEEFHACHVPLDFYGSLTDQDFRHVLAHELFHCVQQASVTPEQWASYGANSTWWAEGSAELFGATAAGGPAPRYNRTPGFEADVRARKPLYEMSYNASIFFFWFDNEYGLRTLVPFLRQMASSGDAAAQMHAMSGALNPETWRRFAQAYDDRTIVHPSGAPLSWGDRIDGETWRIESESARHNRELQRFVIETGWADYECGTWANELNTSSIEVRPENSTTWGAWPASLDTEASGTTRMRIAILSSMATIDLRFAADKRESCRGCNVSRAIDRCVVGRWRQTGGGPAEYLRSRGVPITILNQTQLILTMNDDGTFSTNEIATDAEIEMPTPSGTVRSTGVGRTSAVSGRWSAEGGELQGCIDSGGEREGMTTFPESADADRVSRAMGRGPYINTSPWSGSAAGTSGGATYACSDATFTTSSPTEHGPMEYTFTRETPPPRH